MTPQHFSVLVTLDINTNDSAAMQTTPPVLLEGCAQHPRGAGYLVLADLRYHYQRCAIPAVF